MDVQRKNKNNGICLSIYILPVACFTKKWNICALVFRLEPRHLPKYQLFQLFWFPSIVCFLGVHANTPSCQGCKNHDIFLRLIM